MCVGRSIRWHRVVRRSTGRSVIVALDHGMFLGPVEGIERVDETLKRVVSSGVDAVIVSPGVLSRFADLIAGRGVGLVLRVDHPGLIPDSLSNRLVSNAVQALKLGADALIASYYVGLRDEASNTEVVSRVVNECRDYGLVSVIEVSFIERGLSGGELLRAVKRICRAISEVGADMLKVPYTGDPRGFKEVVDSCISPVVVLGGPRRASLAEFIADVKSAVDSGAIGVAVGRNVWQRKGFERVIEALIRVVHGGEPLSEVLSFLGVRP